MNETVLHDFDSYCGYLIKGEVSPEYLIDRAWKDYEIKIDPDTIITAYFRWGIDPDNEHSRLLYSSQPGKGAFLATVGYK